MQNLPRGVEMKLQKYVDVNAKKIKAFSLEPRITALDNI